MNEPHRGYLELHSMYTFDSNTDLHFGYHANALESFALSDGYSLPIPYYVASFPEPTRISHYVQVNQARERAWAAGIPCIWREHGVWDWDEKLQRPLALRETYFNRDPRTGETFEWYKDCWYPFLRKFQQRIVGDSSMRKDWMTFAAGIPNEVSVNLYASSMLSDSMVQYTPPFPKEVQPRNFVSAPHWYDLHALFSKVSSNSCVQTIQDLSKCDMSSLSEISPLMCKIYQG